MKWLSVIFILVVVSITGCSRKQQPQTAVKTNSSTTDKLSDERATVNKPIRTPVPKQITVNDKVASKTVDGRLYYDLEGHRYWRNYDDGKYYLFNKSMYGKAAFKPH